MPGSESDEDAGRALLMRRLRILHTTALPMAPTSSRSIRMSRRYNSAAAAVSDTIQRVCDLSPPSAGGCSFEVRADMRRRRQWQLSLVVAVAQGAGEQGDMLLLYTGARVYLFDRSREREENRERRAGAGLGGCVGGGGSRSGQRRHRQKEDGDVVYVRVNKTAPTR